ncbi:MAG: hypothetical protein FJ388_26215 [Verrucomicrobia bacterium]|nr:hypothetical protein [Verrucomicrobiota bacterium]
MKPAEIRDRLRAGFRPFTIYLSDARSYTVPHPEFILVAEHGVAVVDKDGFIDSLDPAHSSR